MKQSSTLSIPSQTKSRPQKSLTEMPKSVNDLIVLHNIGVSCTVLSNPHAPSQIATRGHQFAQEKGVPSCCCCCEEKVVTDRGSPRCVFVYFWTQYLQILNPIRSFSLSHRRRCATSLRSLKPTAPDDDDIKQSSNNIYAGRPPLKYRGMGWL